MAHLRAGPAGEQRFNLLAVSVSRLRVERRPRPLQLLQLLLLLHLRASARCVLQSDERFLLQCEDVRESGALKIPPLVRMRRSIRGFTRAGKNADVQPLRRGTCIQIHKHLIRRRRKGRFSDPARQDKAALHFRKKCDLHANNPWSTASPGCSSSSLSLPTSLLSMYPSLPSLHSPPPPPPSSIHPSILHLHLTAKAGEGGKWRTEGAEARVCRVSESCLVQSRGTGAVGGWGGWRAHTQHMGD